MDRVLCPLCQLNITLFNIRQRDEHVNACLEGLSDDCSSGLPEETAIVPKVEPQSGHVEEQCIDDSIVGKDRLDLKQDPNILEGSPHSPLLLEPKVEEAGEVTSPTNLASGDPADDSIEVEQVPKPLIVPAQKRKRAATVPKPKKIRKAPYFKFLEFDEIKIVVDGFCYGDLKVPAYFLTHFHSDHYGGLSKSWCHGDIYCSPATARLVASKLKVNEQYLKPLEMDIEHVILGQKVRFLDANHCPGAAIILFNNNVLHTGDFRASNELIENVKEYTDHLKTLYLDTTYLDPGRTFPTQSFVTETCAEYCLLAQNAKPGKSFFYAPKPTRILVIVGTYTIGKEKLAVKVAKALGSKIWAANEKLKVLALLADSELDELMETENGINCQVHLASMRDLTVDKLEKQWGFLKKHYTEIIAFCPTGWTHSNRTPFSLELMSNLAVKRPFLKICRVPYSEHSSYKELENFCSSISSRRIIPTVSTKHSDILRRWEK